ncbi:MAG: cyclic GMP-AMP synthase DncV-like nucleotidyltransferase [Geitlerinemataceae cyanobacterium]
MSLQSKFLEFHDRIKIDFEGSEPLREKRDLLLHDLQAGLKNIFSGKPPSFTYLNQGSYALATGVEPLADGDYDIDVGIIFDFTRSEYQPVQVKGWICQALQRSTRTVEMKRPCVRVQYFLNQTEFFHVDLAIYATEYASYTQKKELFIAKGYPGSLESKKIWEESDPFLLKKLIKSKFSEGDRSQFRRIIRYLKRWKDYSFNSTANGKPTGIAMTAICYEVFHRGTIFDPQTLKPTMTTCPHCNAL